MLLELPITLLENIYSTGMTYYDCYLQLSYFYSAGHWYVQEGGIISEIGTAVT
jgi:hypothetical protein